MPVMLYILRTLESLGGLICIAGDIQYLNSFKVFQFYVQEMSKMSFIDSMFPSYLNPVWHDVGKQQNCSSLEPPRDTFIRLNELGRISK
jgi:hypothetical protein